MIGIQLESGEYLTLPGNTRLRMQLVSSLFYEEEGSYSFPFNVPIEGNAAKFGFPESMMVVTSVKKFNVVVFLGNNPWKKAVLNIKTIENKNYVCYVQVDKTVLADNIKNKKLSELTLGGERILRTYFYQRVILSGSGTSGNVSLSIAETFHLAASVRLTKTVPFNTSITQTLIDLAAAFNADPSGLSTVKAAFVQADGDTISVYSNKLPAGGIPQIVLFYSPSGASRTWTIVVDQYFIALMYDHMLEAASSTYPDFDYTFFPIKNPGYYNNNDFYRDYVNWFNGDGFGHIPPSSAETIQSRETAIVPFAYLVYIFKKVFSEHNLTLRGDFIKDEEIKKLVIYNNQSVLSYAKIELKNHVPDMTIGEFIKSICAGFNLADFYFNESGEVLINNRCDLLLSSDYEDWTSIAEPFIEEYTEDYTQPVFSPSFDSSDSAVSENIKDISQYNKMDGVESVADLPESDNEVNDLRLVAENNYYYLFDYTETWIKYSENIGQLSGDTNNKIDLKFSTLTTKKFTSPYSDYDKGWLVPTINQPGSSTTAGQGTNPYSLRLLFYRGMQPGKRTDGTDMSYPLGTPYNRDYNGDVIGTNTLATDHIYETYYRKWVEFRKNTRPVKIDLRITDEILNKLNYSLKKRINNVMYFLAKIDLEISQDGNKVATGYFYKIP